MSIITGDCLEVMKTFPDNHFTSVVTDPPYGLHFMGKDWDQFSKGKQLIGRKVEKASSNSEAHNAARYDERRNDEFQEFMYLMAIEALRITKPGGHCLMFGAPRRYHRQTCALEDAGWEIRDCLMWLYGSGFPKSHNHFGMEGYGTALKPAYEPIIMAMKPCEGTFKENAKKWGLAGINIDECRIGTHESWTRDCRGQNMVVNALCERKGRWPANILLDEEAAEMLDEQSGILVSKYGKQGSSQPNSMFYGEHADGIAKKSEQYIGDSGGASRFFYTAKTSSQERNEGLRGFQSVEGKRTLEGGGMLTGSGNKRNNSMKNIHPTVKSLSIMQYLIKLVCPPINTLILDPFAGSGSTIVAAKRLGIAAIGIEKDPEYAKIATARVEAAQVNVQYDLFGKKHEQTP